MLLLKVAPKEVPTVADLLFDEPQVLFLVSPSLSVFLSLHEFYVAVYIFCL